MAVQPISLTEKEHDDFVKTHDRGDLLQLSSWANVKRQNGWSGERIAVATDGKVTGVALLLFKQVPKLPFTLCYAPRGFVVDYDDVDSLRALTDEAKRVAKTRRAITIKIDPNVDRDEVPGLLTEMADLGFTHKGYGGGFDYAQPRFTMETDLRPSEKDIFAKFHHKFRYNVRLAEKKGIVCTEVGRDGLKTFADLMKVTGERDGFAIRGLDYFENLYDCLQPGDARLFLTKLEPSIALDQQQATLDKAKRELEKIERALEKETAEKKRTSLSNRQKQTSEQIAKIETALPELVQLHEKYPNGLVLSGGLLTLAGRRSYYLYGASSNEFREFMPNHLMQWTMMQAAKASGAERYDFGGVSGSTAPDDEYAGLYAFKSGWGSDQIEKVGEFDLVMNRPLYFALETGLPLVKGLRKRLRR
ncbi:MULTISPECIES: lipid II:glycine glycyltransferase FemX [Exiguobacterium]|uniref:Lipid II:glycine glycyltransferase n=1 Tax=Exiguobacterium aurantiacum TaxID=33987 RepID=A0A377FUD3_9BACL|nr:MULTISPECIES: lipid II:glycine glycyltransferase FemX [Exiguobacterium]STO08419.1 Lipid II:glycine glycyltransferase [Exiguobacterium aurantiacum]